MCVVRMPWKYVTEETSCPFSSPCRQMKNMAVPSVAKVYLKYLKWLFPEPVLGSGRRILAGNSFCKMSLF